MRFNYTVGAQEGCRYTASQFLYKFNINFGKVYNVYYSVCGMRTQDHNDNVNFY